ncbi:MAG: hypothetical protein GTO18_22095 [Anaerolineales bacterium]|nr:hypothetical protein [Anaerolineales bacterium]
MSKHPTSPLSEASLDDLAWLSGNWRGQHGKDPIEEAWSRAAGNAMMGMFRWLHEDSVRFYEFMAIEQGEESIIFRIKHFNPGLKGWEEKDESVAFHLVQLKPTEAIFFRTGTEETQWMTYKLNDDDSLLVYFEGEDGEPPPEDILRFNSTR